MTNFGILMEINGIEDPFKWSRDVVNKLQAYKTGLYYSPSRTPSTTSEGNSVSATQISLGELTHVVEPAYGRLFQIYLGFYSRYEKSIPNIRR
jgi:hypothetical protein